MHSKHAYVFLFMLLDKKVIVIFSSFMCLSVGSSASTAPTCETYWSFWHRRRVWEISSLKYWRINYQGRSLFLELFVLGQAQIQIDKQNHCIGLAIWLYLYRSNQVKDSLRKDVPKTGLNLVLILNILGRLVYVEAVQLSYL